LFRFFLIQSLFVLVFGSTAVCADDDISIEIVKTFDHGTLIDHRIRAADSRHSVVMIFSQRRQKEGSDQVGESFLSFRPQRRPDNRPLSSDETHRLVTGIMQALHDKFGENLKLTSLSASGFLNVCEIQENNLRAFAGYQPWQAYLTSDPQQYAQHDAHKMVVHRWRQTRVYADVIRIFQSAGYILELSGFEKLFVQRADKFGCYLNLQSSTIKPSDRFPYPGIVHFTINSRRSQ
jgi:hypothetical protein